MNLLSLLILSIVILNIFGSHIYANKPTQFQMNINFKSILFTSHKWLQKRVTIPILASTISFSTISYASQYPLIGSEEIMSQKSHGTSDSSVQSKLKWNVDVKLADKIANYNRHWAESAGYYKDTTFIKDIKSTNGQMTFYDSVTGKPLFIAPQGRSLEDFLKETSIHGWPSFRDSEVVWDNVRTLNNGETVSLTGTHLGHNLPDRKGNRYCIDLVSIAGNP